MPDQSPHNTIPATHQSIRSIPPELWMLWCPEQPNMHGFGWFREGIDEQGIVAMECFEDSIAYAIKLASKQYIYVYPVKIK